MSTLLICTFLLVLSVSYSVSIPIEGRLFGGTTAEIINFPYQISIAINATQHYCGGAIISPTWIVTAAHCIDLYLVKAKIVAGVGNMTEVSRTGQVKEIDLTNIIIHPEYKQDWKPTQHDIALIKVKTPFSFAENNVQPIFTSKFPCVSVDEPASFSGWGLTDAGAGPAHVLKAANVSTVTFSACQKLLHPYYEDDLVLNDAIHLCVTGRSNPCKLDDGSPLVQDNRLVGLLSWLPSSCGDSAVPTVFTKIGAYTQFIKSHVTDLPTH